MWKIDRRFLLASGFLSALSACSPAKAKAFTDAAELRVVVIDSLRGRKCFDSVVADPVDPAKFHLKIGDWSSVGDVTNILAYLRAYPDEDAEKVVARFVNSFVEAGKGVTGDIVPVIRMQDYVASAKANGGEMLYEPLGADLVIVYMVDRPDSMSPAKSADVRGKNLAAVRKIALDNLRRWLPKVEADGQLGDGVLYTVEENTMLAPSIILLDEFWKSVAGRFPGDVLVALPRKDQLFLFDSHADQAGIGRLIDATLDEGFNLLSPNLYARRKGQIVQVSQ